MPAQVVLAVDLAPGGEPDLGQVAAARQGHVQIPPVGGQGGLHLRPGDLLHIGGGVGHQVLLVVAVGVDEIGAGGVVAGQGHGIGPGAVGLLLGLVPLEVILAVLLAPGGEPNLGQVAAAGEGQVQIPSVGGQGRLQGGLLRLHQVVHHHGAVVQQTLGQAVLIVDMDHIGAGFLVVGQGHLGHPAAILLLGLIPVQVVLAVLLPPDGEAQGGLAGSGVGQVHHRAAGVEVVPQLLGTHGGGKGIGPAGEPGAHPADGLVIGGGEGGSAGLGIGGAQSAPAQVIQVGGDADLVPQAVHLTGHAGKQRLIPGVQLLHPLIKRRDVQHLLHQHRGAAGVVVGYLFVLIAHAGVKVPQGAHMEHVGRAVLIPEEAGEEGLAVENVLVHQIVAGQGVHVDHFIELAQGQILPALGGQRRGQAGHGRLEIGHGLLNVSVVLLHDLLQGEVAVQPPLEEIVVLVRGEAVVQLEHGPGGVLQVQAALADLGLFAQQVHAQVLAVYPQVHILIFRHEGKVHLLRRVIHQPGADHAVVGGVGQQNPLLGGGHTQHGGLFAELDLVGLFGVFPPGGVAPALDLHGAGEDVVPVRQHQAVAGILHVLVLVDLVQGGTVEGQPQAGQTALPQAHRLGPAALQGQGHPVTVGEGPGQGAALPVQGAGGGRRYPAAEGQDRVRRAFVLGQEQVPHPVLLGPAALVGPLPGVHGPAAEIVVSGEGRGCQQHRQQEGRQQRPQPGAGFLDHFHASFSHLKG